MNYSVQLFVYLYFLLSMCLPVRVLATHHNPNYNQTPNSADTSAYRGAAELNGVWHWACHLVDNDPDNGYQAVTLRIGTQAVPREQAAVRIDIFSDAQCRTRLRRVNFVYGIRVGEQIETRDGLRAREIDLTIISDPEQLDEQSHIYDIYYIEGDTLYFGLEEAGHDTYSPAGRPVRLDRSAPHQRR